MTATMEPRNAWRLETPGSAGWPRTARPDDPNKYFMVSADCHITENIGFFATVEPEFRHRVPRMEPREDGSLWMVEDAQPGDLLHLTPK